MSTPRDVYSHGHQASVLRSHGWRTAENSAGYLLPQLRATDHLLDIGCGPGSITLDLASRLNQGRVVGVDNAAEAVTAARRAAVAAGTQRVEFAVGDVYALDHPPETFDVVHAHQVLQHLSDPVAALTEMRRVCKPGGLVAARDADYSAMTWFPASPGLDRWRQLYLRLARANSGEPDAGRRLRSWANRAGFGAVTATASVWCFADPADLGWWTGTWAERLTASAFGRQAVERGLSDQTELAALASGWRAWATQPGAWFSVLHGELLARA